MLIFRSEATLDVCPRVIMSLFPKYTKSSAARKRKVMENTKMLHKLLV